MHELALRTRTDVWQKEKYTCVRPLGMVVQAFSLPRKRRKWMEILADLCSPKKRAMFEQGMVREFGRPLWDALCEHWTPALRERWVALDVLKEGPEKEIGRTLFWDDEVERVSGFRAALGRDPTGTADILDTWLFSAQERRDYLIVVNTDMAPAEAEAQEGFQDLTIRGRLVKTAKAFIDWDADLGLPQFQRDRIRSKNFRVDPRFDQPVAKSLLRPGVSHAEMGRV